MKIVTLNGVKIKPNTIAAIGFFDGVHLAHKKLIQTAIDLAKAEQKESAIITFDIHPKSILYGLDYYYITPLKRKLEIFQTFDIDTVYVIEFTKEKAVLKPQEFVDYYLQNVQTLICGFDFKFGVRGSGNVETLNQFAHFETIVIEEITYEGYKVGSTHIRDLINSGHVDQVVDVLGDYYSIKGEVVHGAKKGRMIGYPTANINTGEYLVPKNGVYATMTNVDGVWYQSMSSIGHNPTLNCRVDVSVESNIFDFNQDIYGETIEIMFIKRLRDELKFDSIEALIAKIDQDKVDTLTVLQNIRK